MSSVWFLGSPKNTCSVSHTSTGLYPVSVPLTSWMRCKQCGAAHSSRSSWPELMGGDFWPGLGSSHQESCSCFALSQTCPPERGFEVAACCATLPVCGQPACHNRQQWMEQLMCLCQIKGPCARFSVLLCQALLYALSG